MISTASISLCGKYRFSLERIWDETKPLALVLLHNPSTADAKVNDPTVLRLIGWLTLWGYGGFRIVNLIPLRSPQPDVALAWWRANRHHQAMLDNYTALALNAIPVQLVLVGYGILASDEHELARTALTHIQNRTTAPVKCLGFTKDGFPIHPMARGKSRVPDDVQPVDFTPLRKAA